jgi:pyruvate/2-oxoglutarate/acetoin dehydrogenase E1 component
MIKTTYSKAIRSGFEYLLQNFSDVFIMGQGLWSPWYVGNTMANLDKKFGKNRVIDSPVSECAVTGMGVGASIMGKKAIIVHPRMDFMLYALDPIVNQAANWRFMFSGKSCAPVTIRAIINRGGEQGAQHSQALHAWFAHIPGLKVVMPYSVSDARDLLIAAVLCKDPVIYIDDRWLYDNEGYIGEISANEFSLNKLKAKIRIRGTDITIVSAGYATHLSLDAAIKLKNLGISAEVIDLRLISHIDYNLICNSVKKTGRLLAVDIGWSNCGLSSEIISNVIEKVNLKALKCNPQKISLNNSPAPTATSLEKNYYFDSERIVKKILLLMEKNKK